LQVNTRCSEARLANLASVLGQSIFQAMKTRDEIFDDANGDLAVGDLDKAVEKYRQCVEVDPEFFDGWHALGMALMKLGRFDEAIEAGKKATNLCPNDQIAWTSLSLFYNRAGNIKEAEAAGTKAKILSWGGKVAGT
jgi:tetratricopeptide (TPR) repeat protein